MRNNQRPGKAAFTLIELMAVITIIVILAGLVVGGLGFVNEKQAKDKARVQIGLLSKACEDFRLDMGYYPPTANSTTGTGNSDDLFRWLYWDSNNDGVGATSPPTGTPPMGTVLDTEQTIYLADLNPYTSKQGWTVSPANASTMIKDPWGNEYRYRSAKAQNGTNNAGTINPDFDLWSCGKDGRSTPNTTGSADNKDDIKN